MRKGVLFKAAVSLLSVLPFASAYYFPNVRTMMQDVIDIYVDTFEPVLQALFGGFGWSSMYLFERLLLFILLAVIIYLALDRITIFQYQKKIRIIVAIIIPLIGIRFVNYEWLNAVLMQYQLLAIVLTAILPFILYFMFLYSIAEEHGILRKVGWALFLGVYAGLWSSAGSEANSTIYFWTIIAALVCLIGDNFIYRRYRIMHLVKTDQNFKTRELATINDEIRKINDQINRGSLSHRDGDRMIADLNRHKTFLMRQH